MISVCTALFSVDGSFRFKQLESSNMDAVERRVTKYLTTDGGADFFDGGWSNADRTLTIKTNQVAEALRMQELGKIHQKWTVAWRDQFAVCHFQRITIAGDTATIELMGDR
mgnify:CR=1 FL=1